VADHCRPSVSSGGRSLPSRSWQRAACPSVGTSRTTPERVKPGPPSVATSGSPRAWKRVAPPRAWERAAAPRAWEPAPLGRSPERGNGGYRQSPGCRIGPPGAFYDCRFGETAPERGNGWPPAPSVETVGALERGNATREYAGRQKILTMLTVRSIPRRGKTRTI